MRGLILATGTWVASGCDSPPSNDQSGTPIVNDYDASSVTLPGHCADKSQVWTKTGCVPAPAIKLNTVGFALTQPKLATLPADSDATTFMVHDVTTDAVVYTGSIPDASIAVPDTGDIVRVADFTEFAEPGTYTLEVAGLSRSPQFEIADAVYNDVFRSSLLGLFGQRCGAQVSFAYDGATFAHGNCHQSDAKFNINITPGVSGTHLATGGWHDAGDYGKYVVNGAFSVAFLVKAWEDFGPSLANVDHLPSGTSSSMPSILAEAKYELDWLLKMQQADGSVLHLVCPLTYPGDAVSPEADTMDRFFLQASTSATGYFAAALAAAARVFRSIDANYADSLLAAAQLAQSWLDAHPGPISAADGTVDAPYLAGGPYNISAAGDAAARAWASVELWRTTGAGDLAAIESTLSSTGVAPSWDWAAVENLAAFAYAAADSTSRDAQTIIKVQTAITAAADTLVTNAQVHGYGRALSPNDYNWGSNGTVARSVMNLWAAYRVNPDAKYLTAATRQLDYLLGRNPYGRSFMTGVGFAPPVNPHHRPSNAEKVLMPWPGLLVGGSNKNAGDPLASSCVTADGVSTPGKCWFDEAGDYFVNEIAINWNAALVYALAGFVR